MIKFETINGTLCRMVEPTPLTENTQFPCLVRMIQDETQMGKYNNDMNCWDTIKDMLWITRNIKGNPLFNKTLHAYEKDSNGQDSCIASIHQLEIIGYPVADGSKDWALWAMMDGHEVCNPDIHGGAERFAVCDGRIVHHVRNAFEDYCAVDSQFFPPAGLSTGWQLYKEPKPEPLLADAKVGDLCKTDLDEWIQIDDTFERPSPILYHFDRPFKGNIIHTEPLAHEGSDEWAWQMLMLGKTVYNPSYYYSSSHGLITPNMLGNCSKQSFVDRQEPSGWQLYKEPKYKGGDWLEFIDAGGRKSQGKYLSNIYHNEILVLDITCNLRVVVHTTKIIRKLSPIDVEVDFGFAKGRILSRTSGDVKVLNNKSVVIASIIVSEITNPTTRSLVESLLKAQKGEK